MPIVGLEPTWFVSQGYCQHTFNRQGYIKKCADGGNRTNVVIFLMLLLARIQLPGLHEEICR